METNNDNIQYEGENEFKNKGMYKIKKFYKKYKWMVNIGIVIVVLLAGWLSYSIYINKVEKDYLSDAKDTLNQMITTGSLSEDMGNKYIDVWHTAIYDGTFDGDPVLGFSVAIEKQQKKYIRGGTQENLKDGIQQVEKMMNDLQDPPKKYEDLYDDMVDMYGNFKDLTGLAKSPSGSYRDYSTNFKEADNKVSNKYDQINVQYFDNNVITEIQN